MIRSGAAEKPRRMHFSIHNFFHHNPSHYRGKSPMKSDTKNPAGKKKWLFAALGAVALAAAAIPALPLHAGAFGWGGHRDHNHGIAMLSDRAIERFSKRLKLNDEQRAALFAAADEVRPKMRAARDQLRAARRALREFDPNAPDYDGKVAALAKTNGEMAAEVTTLIAGMKATLFEVLNDEQERRLARMVARFDDDDDDDDY
ncbi:MAG: periplasmic heavy metal sensor [Gammaproteobacteria bacterium]|nr:periplasmic heavy metal sensor [Gammaproteobacteria bacterium]